MFLHLALALVLDMSRDRVKSADGIGGLDCRMIRQVKISLLYYVLVLRRVFVLALWDGLRLLHFSYFLQNGMAFVGIEWFVGVVIMEFFVEVLSNLGDTGVNEDH